MSELLKRMKNRFMSPLCSADILFIPFVLWRVCAMILRGITCILYLKLSQRINWINARTIANTY